MSTSAASSHAGERATYREYCAWPDDGKRYEILDGKVVEMSAPLLAHQDIVLALGASLRSWFLDSGGGRAWVAPADVILDDGNVCQPDVLAVRTERLSIVRAQGIFGAPDLVVEILSPSTTSRDMLQKRAIYQRHGVHEYWIIDPVRLELWQLVLENGVFQDAGSFTGDAEIESRAFPGMKIRLGPIWPPAAP